MWSIFCWNIQTHSKFYCCFCFSLENSMLEDIIFYSIKWILKSKIAKITNYKNQFVLRSMKFSINVWKAQKIHNRQQFFRNQALILSWSFSSLSASTLSTNKRTNKRRYHQIHALFVFVFFFLFFFLLTLFENLNCNANSFGVYPTR